MWPAVGLSSRRQSMKIWRGWDFNGKDRYGGSPSTGTTIVPRSTVLTLWVWFIQVSKVVPKFRGLLRIVKRRHLGRGIRMARLSILVTHGLFRLTNESAA